MTGLRLLTYNVHSCRGLDQRLRPERTADVIAALEPDVALLQELEVGTQRAGGRDQPAFLADRLGLSVLFHPTLERDGGLYGHAVLSRFPFRVRRSASLPGAPGDDIEPRGALWVEVSLGGRVLPVVSTHLGLTPEDRRAQVEALLGPEWLGHPDCGAGTVLGGDLNLRAGDSSYRRLTERLRDASTVETGGRPQPTWPSPLPLRQLDYILVGEGLEVGSSRVPRSWTLSWASDHLPLVVELELPPPRSRSRGGPPSTRYEVKTMASKICLVLHRKSANEPAVKEAVKHVRGKGIDLRVRIPWNKKDKPRVVQEAVADGANRIIAGGGDGTINAVANALVGKGKKKPRASMGILPLGTANDFAHGCGLPVKDLSHCLEIACTSPPRKIDVGRAGKRCFINVTSGGFGAEITATTPVDMKKALGGGAYTIMGLVKAFNLEPYKGRLLVPGEEPVEGAMLLMAVGNNRLAGGGFEVAPKARLDDGLLDLAMLLHQPEIQATRFVQELKEIDNPDNKYLYYRQLAEFTIESPAGVHFNLDGEPTRQQSLKFSVLPKHLKVVF